MHRLILVVLAWLVIFILTFVTFWASTVHASDEYGTASWYGKPFHGRIAADGSVYDMYALTAAHKTIALGTYIRVTNLSNNATVVLRVTDRGPFITGRIVDVSKAAACQLGMLKSGLANVRVHILENKHVLMQRELTTH